MIGTRISSLLKKITIFFIIYCCSLSAQGKYGGGSGTLEDPYQIWDANHMQAIGADANDWDKCFKLMADIDLSRFAGTTFNIIGNTTTPFVGVFDGNGHTISNFTCTYTSTGRNYVGLFGYVDSPTAEIKHLTLIGVKVDAFWRDYVGSLVGQLSQGTITNCYLEGGSISGHWYVGGLVGSNGGMISNSYSYIGIWGDWSVGGLVGLNDDGTISNCYSAGMVQGKTGIGGLVGSHVKTITNCYSTANVSGDHVVGGLVGRSGGTITNSYSVGIVSGKTDMVGGLVGMYDSGSIFGSFWDIHTSGHTSSYGGTGKTTAEMQDANTFIDAGWGCGSDWTIDEGKDYPRLGWENMPGGPLTLPSYEGSGTEVDPYLIYTAEELNTIGLMTCDWDKHFKLMADVDLGQFTGEEFKIIGYYVSSFDYKPFTGVFDGNGHTISNFSHIATDKSFIGLFGYVSGENAEIKNLGLIALNVDAGTGHSVGSLVGCLEEGTITECYVEGGSAAGNDYVGGLVGSNGGTISNCYSTGSVSGHHSLGGLCGFNNLGTINNSYATGSVTGDENSSRLGGLVGYNRNGSSVSSCYSTGSVSGHHDVGGLVGRNNGAVSASFWDIETSEQTSSAGGWGKTTAQMQKASTFGAWACVDNFAWTIDEGNDYPRLVWENKPGELITIPSGLYGGGSGEPDDPYLIYTAEQLNTIGLFPCHLDKHFLLCADIDLSSFTGTSFNTIRNFTGVFEGKGHTISNFIYTSTGIGRVGLFGYVDGPNAKIKDLGLIDPYVQAGTSGNVGSLVGDLRGGIITNCYVKGGSVSGNSSVGGLVGNLEDTTITNCYVEGSSISGQDNVGSLVGYCRGIITDSFATDCNVTGNDYVGGLMGTNYGTITNCDSTNIVTGDDFVGGLVGRNYYGTISKCYSIGTVTGTGSNIGGLVGYNYGNSAKIRNCYSTVSVFGDDNVGGLVGENVGSGAITNSYSTGSVSGTGNNIGGLAGKGGKFSNCYSTVDVSGYDKVGGLVGYNYYGTISQCYAKGSVSGNDYIGGLAGYSYYGTITNCYSTGSVTGDRFAQGLVGYNPRGAIASFWDIETSGKIISAGGTGLPTDQMQMQTTFTDAGWDFIGETFNGIEDIWFIPQQDYPHLWWEGMKVPMKLTPVSLNCRSQGNWVKAHLTLPEGFTVVDVNSERTAVLHSFGFQSLPPYVFVNKDKLVQIEAAFEREAICSLAGNWPQELTVAGFLADGNIFLGNSTVRIIHPGMKVIEELANCWLQGDCIYPETDMNRDSVVNLLDYALLMNINVEFVTNE